LERLTVVISFAAPSSADAMKLKQALERAGAEANLNLLDEPAARYYMHPDSIPETTVLYSGAFADSEPALRCVSTTLRHRRADITVSRHRFGLRF
jgi:hypothetical protein